MKGSGEIINTIVMIIIVISIFFVLVTDVFSGAAKRQKVVLEETELLKVKNTFYLVNKSLAETWRLSTVQAIFRSADSSIDCGTDSQGTSLRIGSGYWLRTTPASSGTTNRAGVPIEPVSDGKYNSRAAPVICGPKRSHLNELLNEKLSPFVTPGFSFRSNDLEITARDVRSVITAGSDSVTSRTSYDLEVSSSGCENSKSCSKARTVNVSSVATELGKMVEAGRVIIYEGGHVEIFDAAAEDGRRCGRNMEGTCRPAPGGALAPALSCGPAASVINDNGLCSTTRERVEVCCQQREAAPSGVTSGSLLGYSLAFIRFLVDPEGVQDENPDYRPYFRYQDVFATEALNLDITNSREDYISSHRAIIGSIIVSAQPLLNSRISVEFSKLELLSSCSSDIRRSACPAGDVRMLVDGSGLVMHYNLTIKLTDRNEYYFHNEAENKFEKRPVELKIKAEDYVPALDCLEPGILEAVQRTGNRNLQRIFNWERSKRQLMCFTGQLYSCGDLQIPNFNPRNVVPVGSNMPGATPAFAWRCTESGITT